MTQMTTLKEDLQKKEQKRYNYSMKNYGYNFRIYIARNSSNMNTRNGTKQKWSRINRNKNNINSNNLTNRFYSING